MSTDIQDVRTGWSRTVAVRITPVSPMPPAVASNSGVPGTTVRTCPSAVSSSNDSTWREKDPLTWWFLPWMSAPIAPPTVTYRVPGVTGTNQPSGSSTSISRCRDTPASHSTVPPSASIAWIRSRPVMSKTSPPAFCAASPYARPRPRAMPPRAPHPRTARAASSNVRGRTSRAADGAVRPHPVTETVSAGMTATVSPLCEPLVLKRQSRPRNG